MKIEWKTDTELVISDSMKKNKVAGIAMSLISNGEVIHSDTYGVINTMTREPVQHDTKFEAASLTKPLFSYLVMRLCDKKFINLNTPVFEYLPEYEISCDLRYKIITPENILCHSSGIEDWSPKPLNIYFEPGSKFLYSGEAYTYLQKAVENVMGRDLGQLAEGEIFKPLQMNNSTLSWTHAVNNHLSYTFDSQGRMEQKRTHSGFSVCTEPNAACTLYTTIDDYTKFILNIIDNKNISLSSASFNNMIDAHNKISENLFWGLGWGIYRKENKLIWHWGDNGSFQSFVCLDLNTKSGVLIFTNSFNGLNVCYDIAGNVAAENFNPIREFVAHAEDPTGETVLPDHSS